jgi:hypothetical protein
MGLWLGDSYSALNVSRQVSSSGAPLRALAAFLRAPTARSIDLFSTLPCGVIKAPSSPIWYHSPPPNIWFCLKIDFKNGRLRCLLLFGSWR